MDWYGLDWHHLMDETAGVVKAEVDEESGRDEVTCPRGHVGGVSAARLKLGSAK